MPPPPPHFCRDAVRSPQREGAKEGNAAVEVLWTGGGGALSAWAVTGTPSENLSQPAWPTCPHQGGCWGPRSSRPGGLWTECVHPEEAGASPPEAWAAAPRSSSQPSRASKLVPHPSAAAPCPDGPGRSPAAGWAASCRQQSLSSPARDPHRLLRSFRRGPLPAGQTPGCPRPSAVWAQTSLPSASSPTQPSGPVLPLPHEQKTKLRLVLQTHSLLPTPGLSPGSALRPSHLPPLPPTARGGSVVTRAWAVEPTATDPHQTTRAAELFNRASVSSSEK